MEVLQAFGLQAFHPQGWKGEALPAVFQSTRAGRRPARVPVQGHARPKAWHALRLKYGAGLWPAPCKGKASAPLQGADCLARLVKSKAEGLAPRHKLLRQGRRPCLRTGMAEGHALRSSPFQSTGLKGEALQTY